MKNWTLVIGTVALGVLISFPHRLLASCSQAFCPIETSTTVERHPGRGELHLHLNYEFIDQDDIYVGTSSAQVGEIRRHHDEKFTRNHTYKFSLDYGLTSRLTIGVLVPFLDRLHEHISHEEEEVIGGGPGGELDSTEIVNVPERWRYQEFGDLQVTARYLLLQPKTPRSPALSLILGVKLPTSRTGVDNDEGEKAELTLQPGNGSWDGIVGLSYLQSFTVPNLRRQYTLAPLFITASSRFPIGVGKFGYKPGWEGFLNIGLAYPLFHKFDLLGQVNFHYRDKDSPGHAPGVAGADTGRVELFLSPGVRYHLTNKIALYSLMQFAVYRNVNGIQQTADWALTSGVTYRFNLPWRL